MTVLVGEQSYCSCPPPPSVAMPKFKISTPSVSAQAFDMFFRTCLGTAAPGKDSPISHNAQSVSPSCCSDGRWGARPTLAC